jgi:hypothetical protein
MLFLGRLQHTGKLAFSLACLTPCAVLGVSLCWRGVLKHLTGAIAESFGFVFPTSAQGT